MRLSGVLVIGVYVIILKSGRNGQKKYTAWLDSNAVTYTADSIKKGFGSNLPRWLAAPATLSKVQAVKGNEVQARQRRPLYSASTAQ